MKDETLDTASRLREGPVGHRHCPECKDGLLGFISGSFGSGVFAPDGVQETLYEEWFECDRCGRKFDLSDLDLDERGPEDLIMPQQR